MSECLSNVSSVCIGLMQSLNSIISIVWPCSYLESTVYTRGKVTQGCVFQNYLLMSRCRLCRLLVWLAVWICLSYLIMETWCGLLLLQKCEVMGLIYVRFMNSLWDTTLVIWGITAMLSSSMFINVAGDCCKRLDFNCRCLKLLKKGKWTVILKSFSGVIVKLLQIYAFKSACNYQSAWHCYVKWMIIMFYYHTLKPQNLSPLLQKRSHLNHITFVRKLTI